MSVLMLVIMGVVFIASLIVAAYMRRCHISNCIEKEFDVVFECFDKEDTTSRDILGVLMNTKYVRNIKGIGEVCKCLCSCHRMRAYVKLTDIESNWDEHGFKVLGGFVYY